MAERDPTLDSFEAVMRRMDEALARASSSSSTATPSAPAPSSASSSKKGKAPAASSLKASSSSTSSTKARAAPAAGSKKDPNAMDLDPSSDDPSLDSLLSAMDSELHAALLSMDAGSGSDDDGDDDDGEGLDGDQAMDYGLIKNFLESYQAQGGMAGPVGNLLGRLGEGKGKN